MGATVGYHNYGHPNSGTKSPSKTQNMNWAIGPTVTTTLSAVTNQGLQSSSDPNGKKDYSAASAFLTTPKVLSRTQRGPIRTRPMAQLRSTAHPRPPLGPAGQSPLRSRPPRRGPRQRASPPPRSRVADLPSGERTDSASLEATPRRTELVIRSLTCPSDEGIK